MTVSDDDACTKPPAGWTCPRKAGHDGLCPVRPVEDGMRLVYLAHPLGAPTPEGVTANIASAKKWIRWVYDNFPNVAILADWLITCEVLDDFNPEHRKRGMAMNKAIIPKCREFWMVGGRISNGMADEQDTAEKYGRRIFDLTWLGATPPVDLPERVRELCA